MRASANSAAIARSRPRSPQPAVLMSSVFAAAPLPRMLSSPACVQRIRQPCAPSTVRTLVGRERCREDHSGRRARGQGVGGRTRAHPFEHVRADGQAHASSPAQRSKVDRAREVGLLASEQACGAACGMCAAKGSCACACAASRLRRTLAIRSIIREVIGLHLRRQLDGLHLRRNTSGRDGGGRSMGEGGLAASSVPSAFCSSYREGCTPSVARCGSASPCGHGHRRRLRPVRRHVARAPGKSSE